MVSTSAVKAMLSTNCIMSSYIALSSQLGLVDRKAKGVILLGESFAFLDRCTYALVDH